MQLTTDTDEHHIVHVLYSLQKAGLVEFRRKRAIHSPGLNLTNIKLTPRGREVYRRLGR